MDLLTDIPEFIVIIDGFSCIVFFAPSE